MAFEIKVNDEVVHTVDVDPRLVDHVLLNESQKIPVQFGQVSLTLRVVIKSASDLEVVEAMRREARTEYEEEATKDIPLQDNPVAVALEEEFPTPEPEPEEEAGDDDKPEEVADFGASTRSGKAKDKAKADA